jgi:predicted DNA-binding protein YlxM (UPF0122 family)
MNWSEKLEDDVKKTQAETLALGERLQMLESQIARADLAALNQRIRELEEQMRLIALL